MSDVPELTEGVQLPDGSGRRFLLLEQIGRGGFSEVFLARLEQPDGISRRVALKLLHPGLDPEGQPLERMRDEAKLLASLEHPAILSAEELVTLGGRVGMVSEYVDGVDFKDCLEQEMPKGPILEVIEQVAEALHVAWDEHQVVHRDIKPANIRIGAYGNVKLLDFGIARYEGITRSAQTTSGTLLGTLTYLAPERFDLDGGTPEPASDIFSLGCVLYEAWTGARFYGGLEAATLLRLTEDADQFESYLDEKLTERSFDPIGALLADLLSFHPDERPSALEVARRCEQLAAAWPDRLTLRRWCRQRRWPDPAYPVEDTPPPIVTSRGVTVSSMTLSKVLDAPTVPVPERPEAPPPEPPAPFAWADELLASVPRSALVAGAGVAILLMLITLAVVVFRPGRSAPTERRAPADMPRLPVAVEAPRDPEPELPPPPVRVPTPRPARVLVEPPPEVEVVEPPAPVEVTRHPVLVTSVPSGAEIAIGERFEAYTPATLELASGTYTLSLVRGDARIDKSVKVGPFARGYVWCIESASWKSTSSADWREAARACAE